MIFFFPATFEPLKCLQLAEPKVVWEIQCADPDHKVAGQKIKGKVGTER